METPELFKSLEVDGRPAIPSFVEALPMLDLDGLADMPKVVSEQFKYLADNYAQFGIESTADMKALTFLVPLTAFIPLPTPYNACIVSKSPDTEELVGFTCVTIQHYEPKLTLGDKEAQLKLSYALVTVADEGLYGVTEKLEEMKVLYQVYDDALAALNSVIHAYKSTPMRHSHILQPQSALGSPDAVPILFSSFPDDTVIEQQSLMLHGHFIGEFWQSRDMTAEELENFQKTHMASRNSRSVPHWLVTKLNEAIDARCNGKDDSAIVFADLYAELSMRFLLYGVLTAKGESHAKAKARAQNHKKIDELIKDLAKELSISPTKFKQDVGYATWNQVCRKVRNKLNHEVQRPKITPKQSFKAVDTSASMIRKIAEAVNTQYPGANGDTQWLINASWMTDSIKEADKKS